MPGIIKLFCSKCGILDKALVNGYDVGERPLEGIKFIVEVKDNKLICSGTLSDRDKKYIATNLSEQEVYKKVADYIGDAIDDGEVFECFGCNDFTAEVIEEVSEEKKKLRIFKGKTSIADYEAANE